VCSALLNNHTQPANFRLYIVTHDIEDDRVECPLRKCVERGFLRLADARRVRQMRKGMEMGVVASYSWWVAYRYAGKYLFK
jgi:hypothetical protein